MNLLKTLVLTSSFITTCAGQCPSLPTKRLSSNSFSTFPDIVGQLGPQLSKNATIVVPNSPGFLAAAERWQDYNDPSFSAVVEVGIEDDIVKTVSYANNYSIPFLAVSGGHGATNSFASLQNGIEIHMRALNKIRVSADGSYATIQGGCINKEVTDALWAAGKQSTTGAGECSGFTAAGLGGGHGFLQGRYGLIADNIMQARIVLGNGSVVVTSTTSNSDLFYAIRGAGHNFGILTEMKYKVYDVFSNGNWYYENFIFSGQHIKPLFDQINAMMAVVLFSILYNGPQSSAQPYVAPYHTLNPISTNNGTTDFPSLAAVTGNDVNSQICEKGFNRLKFPINLQQYDPPSQQAIFDKFSNLTAQPAFNNSLLIFEAYSLEAVQAVPDESTAFPQRSDHIIISPVITYLPDPSLDNTAIAFGHGIRTTLLAGSGSAQLHAYVNYAHGDETQEQIYGSGSDDSDWRLSKLQRIKRAYDPLNRFRWFAPIL